MTNYICLDIGGTAVKYGITTEKGRFIFKNWEPNQAAGQGRDAFLAKLARLIEAAKNRYDVQGVAVATAGVVNPETGIILFASDNIPGYSGTRLKEYLTGESNLPVEIENDVNAVALGEYWQGAGRGARSLFCLAVGTGIGGGLILDGQLVHGASFSAGEAGYMKIAGERSWEEVASTKALVQEVARAKGLTWAPEGRHVFQWARDGDREAREAIERLVANLSRGIAAICYVVNPEVVILGGGIMEQVDYLRPLFARALSRELLPAVYEKTRLDFARLGNDAGMTGALYNLLRRQSGRPAKGV